MSDVKIPFVKMVGTGNDFVIVEAGSRRLASAAVKWPAVARAMCDRRYGVGADGLLVLEQSHVADVRMRVFNPDGSEAEMCGNGARCVAGFIHVWKKRRGADVSIESLGGLVRASIHGDRVRIQMPEPRDAQLDVPLKINGHIRSMGFVDTGVPHVVAVVDSVDEVDVEQLGRTLRHHAAFQPRGANVNFIEPDRKQQNRLRVRTYERGVEGETLACGTGVTAAAVIHALSRAERNGAAKSQAYRIDVQARSGEWLAVSLSVVSERGRLRATNVTLEGPVRRICEGIFFWSGKGQR